MRWASSATTLPPLALIPRRWFVASGPKQQSSTTGTELAFPVPTSDRRLPVRALLALGLALATGAAAGWYYLAGEGGVSAATLAVIPRYLGPQYLGPRYLESIAEQAVALAPDGLKKLVATAAPGATAPLQPVDRLTPMPGDGRIMLRALAEVSFLVKDGSGAVLLNRIMQPGESWVAPARSDLILTTGNAGETEILVDGTPVGGPGGEGRCHPGNPA